LAQLITLSVLAGEAELFDPAVTGQFADAMAHLAAQPQTPPFCGYIGRRGNVPVGFGGFKGALNDDGIVEIGYLTFPQHEGTGVAKAVAANMVDIARANGATAVLAHTLCEENASTGVLRANGFVRDGEGFDDEEGVVWRWRLDF
jgi:[ribosomal protein S5]-alanine N-acetyltransferase